MILGLLIGILGTAFVFALVLGLAGAAHRRDDWEDARYDHLPVFSDKPVELVVVDLGFPAWVSGEDDAA